jgi:hypothetical protein
MHVNLLELRFLASTSGWTPAVALEKKKEIDEYTVKVDVLGVRVEHLGVTELLVCLSELHELISWVPV